MYYCIFSNEQGRYVLRNCRTNERPAHTKSVCAGRFLSVAHQAKGAAYPSNARAYMHNINDRKNLRLSVLHRDGDLYLPLSLTVFLYFSVITGIAVQTGNDISSGRILFGLKCTAHALQKALGHAFVQVKHMPCSRIFSFTGISRPCVVRQFSLWQATRPASVTR